MTRVESRARGIRIPHLRWYICGLVFIATVINYLDRQVFSILAPQLQKEIGWSELEYGRIVIAFQVAYATMMLISGRIIDRIGTKLSFSLAVVAWSLVEMAHALARSAFGFGVARFFLALTEAANFPAASKAVSEWFGPSERAFATGIFISGVGAGAIVASLMVPPLAASVGWQWTFVITGLMERLLSGSRHASSRTQIYEPVDAADQHSSADNIAEGYWDRLLKNAGHVSPP